MSSIKSIKWHQKSLHNLKQHLYRLRDQSNYIISQIEKLTTEIEFYENQINRAIKMKKEKFDSSRFGM